MPSDPEPDAAALVRRWVAAYNARDEAEFLNLAHPDVVIRPVRAGAAPEYRGHDGIRRWVQQLAQGDHRLVLDAVSALENRIVAEGSVDEEVPWVAVFEFRDGRVVFAQGYYSDRRSLERLGILSGR